ncbi:MAG TPA: zf-HC2 domain-containing protein [Kofleriaceae bacterium]|nr:zf-HC2 domain-containing protein [Kofleriaceae bacterium]
MIGCRDTDRLVTAYVDGDLDERRSSALRGHLRVCTRCAARVEDEVRLRDAAARLEPLDPPADLWQAIDARLAEEEIADAQRGRLWLWWQRGVDVVRRHAIPAGALGAAAAAALAIWIAPSGDEPARRHAAPAVAGAGEVEPAAGEAGSSPEPDGACAGAAGHDELVLCQMHRSDRRYLQAIEELSAALADERSAWSAEDAARFDAAIAELDRAAQDELKRLAARGAASPADRDPLYAIYRAKIDLLSQAVVGGVPAEGR